MIIRHSYKEGSHTVTETFIAFSLSGILRWCGNAITVIIIVMCIALLIWGMVLTPDTPGFTH